MSQFQVLARHVVILPHPNADRLDLAQVDDFRCVVGRGLYSTGDLVAYVPEQSILPPAVITELELDGKLGSGGRVKPVKLRGELSQGVCIPARPHWNEGDDVGEELGITKWEPATPKVLAGNVYHLGVTLTVNYDIDNIKRWPRVIEEGEPVVMTEKLHGTFVQFLLVPTCLIKQESPTELPPAWERRAQDDSTVLVGPDETVVKTVEEAWTRFRADRWLFAVTSKGVGAKGNVLKLHDPSNNSVAYVRAARDLDMYDRMLQVFGTNDVPITVCGELYGAGVQDLTYGETGGSIGFRVFDVHLGTRERGRYLHDEELDTVCKNLGLPRVPVLYRGPFSRDKLLELTDGRETVSGKATHIREGVVVCPLIERHDDRAGRVKFKSVSVDYLTRKGGTEHN